MINLKNTNVVLTGATGGIGRDIVAIGFLSPSPLLAAETLLALLCKGPPELSLFFNPLGIYRNTSNNIYS